MFHNEYMQWAQTAEAGNLTEFEANNNWTAWENDPKLPSDTGNRGLKRLLVKKADYVEDLNGVKRQRVVERLSKQAKNPTEKALQAMIKQVMQGEDDEGDPFDCNRLQSRARNMFATGESISGSLGLAAPNLQQMGLGEPEQLDEGEDGMEVANDGEEAQTSASASSAKNSSPNAKTAKDGGIPGSRWFNHRA